MSKELAVLLAISALALGVTGCMDGHRGMRMQDKPEAKREVMETITDASGTTTVKQSTIETVIDENGNKKEIITSKITKDPRGLFNKTTTKSKTRVIEENKGDKMMGD